MGQQYSNYSFCSTVTKCLSGGYANIPASGRGWDNVAKANYCISGSTVYSFQDTNSVKAIAQWGRANGFGGIMIYDLGTGYENAPGTVDHWALLHAIYNEAQGSAPEPVAELAATPFFRR